MSNTNTNEPLPTGSTNMAPVGSTIVDIPLDLIDDHPAHEPIYGIVTEASIGAHIRNSIAIDGVLSPAHVVAYWPNEDDPFCRRYLLLSGRRRKLTSRLVGRATLPCIIDECPDPSEQRKRVVLYNDRDHKRGERVIAAEIDTLEITLVHPASAFVSPNLTRVYPPWGPGAHLGDSADPGGRIRDQIATLLNLPGKRVRMLREVFGSIYQAEKIEEFKRKKVAATHITAAVERWESIRRDRDVDAVSLTRAAASVAGLITETLATAGKKGAAKPAAPAKSVRLPFTFRVPTHEDLMSFYVEDRIHIGSEACDVGYMMPSGTRLAMTPAAVMRGQMMVFDAATLVKTFVLPSLPHLSVVDTPVADQAAPVDTPSPAATPLEEAIAEACDAEACDEDADTDSDAVIEAMSREDDAT